MIYSFCFSRSLSEGEKEIKKGLKVSYQSRWIEISPLFLLYQECEMMILWEKRGIISWLMTWVLRVLPLGDNNGNHGNHIAMVTRYVVTMLHAQLQLRESEKAACRTGKVFPTQLHTTPRPTMNLSYWDSQLLRYVVRLFSGNRPGQQILIPDWLIITCHVLIGCLLDPVGSYL